MTRYRYLLSAGLVVVAFAALMPRPPVQAAAGIDTLPDRLTDQQFWQLVEDLSEPNGYFRSDNLVSNEIYFQSMLDDLLARSTQRGVYLGVGPEQNFTYITALEPKMVFITDVRRGNLWTQLMYKALFELSADRAEFVSRLFTKPRPDGLDEDSTASEIINAFWDPSVVTSASDVYERNAKDIVDLLTVTHALPLAEQDIRGIIDSVYYNFYWFGPSITYSSSSTSNGGRRGGNFVNWADLMIATDDAGVERSFLASKEHFQFMKNLESRNLVVPIVGNFGGKTALRAVGQYIRDHEATVSAMYLSNVEQYLEQDNLWRAFCANVATMPLDASSTFIRSSQNRGGGGGRGGGLVNSLGSMQAETQGCRSTAR